MCSVKEGKNVEEAMDFLIEKILDRMEKFAKEGNTVFRDQIKRETIQLKNYSNRNTTSSYRSKNQNGSCCSSES